ncbi:hypothetical protein O9992_15930 [Vibrio lentus]|nr:hypothetical protein [Vibrio lentus]
MLSAVLAGSVFGDHCSSTLTQRFCLLPVLVVNPHADHVSTWLPYALSVAFVSCIVTTLGMTLSSIGIAFSAASLTFVAVCFALAYFLSLQMATCKS